MFGSKSPEVLVVGAGPVGLFTALELVRRGVRVQVVDKDWRTGAHSYALALHAQSLPLLDEAGLLGAVRERANPVHTLALYDGNGLRATLPLGTGDAAVAVLRQDVLEGLLEQALSAQGVKVQWNHQVGALAVQNQGILAEIDKMEKDSLGYAVAHTEWVVAHTSHLEVPYVVGADGHRSTVRRALGTDYESIGAAKNYAVFEFQTDYDFEGQLRLMLGDQTTDVLWPLPEGYCRWSFQLPDAALPASSRTKDRVAIQIGRSSFPILSEESLRALVAERAPWFGGSIGEIAWRIAVRFESRLAGSFGHGRMWLAGDAGHMTGPAGMQSMNVGLREGRELAAALAGVLRDDQPAEKLDDYGRGRRAEWRSLLGVKGGLQASAEADPWVAGVADRLLPCLPASGEELVRLAGKLGLALG